MDVVSGIGNLNILEKMSTFEAANTTNPMFKVMHHYMVMEMLAFIRAVRTGDWSPHLITLEMFTKYFFAHCKINCACMIPVCIAEVSSLKASDPEIYEEFAQGNLVVNKIAKVPFCSIGADNALQHKNCSMDTPGGLVGIILNEAEGVAQLTATIERFTNPFTDAHTELFNPVAKVVKTVKLKDLCEQSEISRSLFVFFVKEGVQSGEVNLWSPMKRKHLTKKISAKRIGRFSRV